MAKRMSIMLLACLVVFGGVFGMKYMGGKAMADYFANMPAKAVSIVSANAEAMSWPQIVPTVGSLVAVNGTMISTEAKGIVQAIHFTAGSEVKSGDPLVSLDARVDEADLHRLQAQAKIAQSELQRASDLHRRKVLSEAELDRKRAEAKAATAAMQAQQVRVDQKRVLAPFDGVLGIRQVNVGDYLAAGTALVSLQSLDPIELQFALPESTLSLVHAGLDVQVSVEAWPEQTFDGQITAIEPTIDPDTRNFYGRVSLKNPDKKLRPGMFARLKIQRPGNLEVVAIPRSAVKYDSYGTSVFVITASEDDPETLMARNRFVQLGQARGDFIQVVDGLKAGEQVAAGGLLKLRNNTPVTIDEKVPVTPNLKPALADS